MAGVALLFSGDKMSRWIGFLICAILGLVIFFGGLLVPAHLRAVDVSVLQRAGRSSPSLVVEGLAQVKRNQLGTAQMYLAAAQSARFSTNSVQLSEAVHDLARQRPDLRVSGSAESGSVGALIRSNATRQGSNATLHVHPFTEFIIRTDSRSKALELLRASPNSLVQELLPLRSATNTVLFPAVSSSSGQALDAAICICGLLKETGHLSQHLSEKTLALVEDANRTGNTELIEQVLMDFLSLGQRFNWGQLATFVEPINDPETLRILATLVRRGESVPVIYAGVRLTGNAAGVTEYLGHFSETGLKDLRFSLAYGAGGVSELLRRNQRLCNARFCKRLATLGPSRGLSAAALDFSLRKPWLSLASKWLLYLLGGFFLAAAVHFARRVPELEKSLQVRGFHLAREFLFALGFLLVVLLVSEPFLSQGTQQEVFPLRLRLSTLGKAVLTGTTGATSSLMNESNLLALLLFFVLQALLYSASVVKLAEIRRQKVGSRVKLKLLDNEDHLFDAGLYLGFVGTIFSLILFSLGIIKPSLMAAYSSTSFGIIFVSSFKIFNLRPLRRRLLLEAEAEPATPSPNATEPSFASQS